MREPGNCFNLTRCQLRNIESSMRFSGRPSLASTQQIALSLHRQYIPLYNNIHVAQMFVNAHNYEPVAQHYHIRPVNPTIRVGTRDQSKRKQSYTDRLLRDQYRTRTRGRQANLFLKSVNRRSAKSQAHSAIANPQISQVCQSANRISANFYA